VGRLSPQDRITLPPGLVLDYFPSSLPVELIELLFDGDVNGLGLLRFLRMFRLLRLLKLLKVDAVISPVEERYELNLKSLRIVQMVLKLLFLAHMLGCFFYYVADNSRDDYDDNWVDSYSTTSPW